MPDDRNPRPDTRNPAPGTRHPRPDTHPPDACAHCGFALGRRPVAATVDDEHALFCCYGCVLALQITRARGETGAAATILIRVGLAIFFTINVMMVSMPAYVPYVYGNDAAATDGPLFQVLRVLALVFAAPVLLLLGWPILKSAAAGLRRGSANTDALIVLGTVAAYVLSVANTIKGEGAVYFDTAAMLLVLVTIGRYLEATAKASAGSAIDATLNPSAGLATRARRGLERVDPAILMIGDLVRVTPGEFFPTDGVVVEGRGGVDEAALTGESAPVVKRAGSSVAGGTCSVDGVFTVRVSARAAESATARITALLAAARRERAPSERFADRVAAVLVPFVIFATLAAGTYWYVHSGIEAAILVALAVLVVACPCGLGIATPVAVWTGLATAAKRGVIVRTAPVFERLATVKQVLFDKTGTLTERVPQLRRVVARAATTEDEVLALAAAVERGLLHPIARAITTAAQQRGIEVPEAVDVQVVPGHGARGIVAGRAIAVGNLSSAPADLGAGRRSSVRSGAVVDARHAVHLPSHTDPPTDSVVTDYGSAGPVAYVWEDDALLGVIELAEAPRPETAAAVAETRKLRMAVGVLSGDNRGDALVPQLFAAHEAAFGLLPQDKVARLRAQRDRATAMVGDGINDAPALAAADVGIAVGSATDLARMTADVTIISDDLRRVPWLLAYSKRVAAVIRQNLFWAFAYNAGAVIAAAAGLLNPLIASLAMLGSSLAVVANARRLRRG